MTELQLKIMDRADKTLSFGCEVMFLWTTSYIWENTFVERTYERTLTDKYGIHFYDWYDEYWPLKENTRNFNKIIWHPYWFERILYLHWQKLPPSNSQQAINFQKIIYYIKEKNQRPLLEKCTDWDEEWQQIVLDFLLSLPK